MTNYKNLFQKRVINSHPDLGEFFKTVTSNLTLIKYRQKNSYTQIHAIVKNQPNLRVMAFIPNINSSPGIHDAGTIIITRADNDKSHFSIRIKFTVDPQGGKKYCYAATMTDANPMSDLFNLGQVYARRLQLRGLKHRKESTPREANLQEEIRLHYRKIKPIIIN